MLQLTEGGKSSSSSTILLANKAIATQLTATNDTSSYYRLAYDSLTLYTQCHGADLDSLLERAKLLSEQLRDR